MHNQTNNKTLVKKRTANTRLQNGPVFVTYKPNNEKAKANVLYRGAIEWNTIDAKYRNMDFNHFKVYQKGILARCYIDG